MDKQVTHLHGQALNPEKSQKWLQTQGFSGSTSGTHVATPGCHRPNTVGAGRRWAEGG